MKCFLFLFIFSTSILNAQNFVKVNGLDVSIKNNAGTGSADFFRVDTNSYLRSRDKFDLDFQETSAFFKFRNNDLEVKNLPPFLTKRKELNIQKLKLDYKHAGIGLLEFVKASFGSKVSMNDVGLKCYDMGAFNFDQLLVSCSKGARARAASVVIKQRRGQNIITDISLVITGNKFYLTGKWQKGFFKGKFTAAGEVYYLTEEKIMKVKINTAKIGIVSIKNTLFALLKNYQSKSFKVKKPYLYISLD